MTPKTGVTPTKTIVERIAVERLDLSHEEVRKLAQQQTIKFIERSYCLRLVKKARDSLQPIKTLDQLDVVK